MVKLTESGLPVVSVGALESLLAEPDIDEILTDAYKLLKEDNPELFAVASAYAGKSKDPEKVFLCAFLTYYLLDKQAHANKMEKSFHES